MNRFIAAFLCALFVLAGSVAHAQEKLTNVSVVEMVELGFDKAVVVEKINSSACTFDTSIEALKALKNQGVPSEVLAAMVKASKPTAAKAKTGIYASVDGAEVQILPTVFSGTKTNTLAAAFSYGIASAKVKSVIGGAASANVLPSGNVAFVFYFDPEKGNALGQNDWWFRAATSPNEFALARFNVNKNKNYRELEVGSINMWAGSNTGVTEKLIVPVSVEQKGEGVFVVAPTEPLEPGEYCFYYKGIIPQGGYNNQSAFDFSIPASAEPVAATTALAFVPEVGYVTLGTEAVGLPAGLLYVGRGLYLEARPAQEAGLRTWAEAQRRCAAKGLRLPARDELKKLVAPKAQASLPEGYAFAENYHWSATEEDASTAWGVFAPNGEAKTLPKAVQAYVRCVYESPNK